MKNLQVFLKITGETLFLSSVFTLNLGINLSHAAKMHGCQGKSSAKMHDFLEKLAGLVKKSLDLWGNGGIIPDGKTRRKTARPL